MRRLRILCFVQPGSVSRALFLDFIDGLTRAGHTCMHLELASIWKRFEAEPARRPAIMSAASAQVSAAIKQHTIDLSIGMWANAISSLSHGSRDGRAMTCFELMDPPHPHLQYWLDAPQWAQNGSVRDFFPTGIFKSRWLLNYVNNEPVALEMRRVLGFAHALGLPYGVNETIFKPGAGPGDPPPPMKDREFDLCFTLGPGDPPPTPTMLRELERDEPDMAGIRAEEAWRIAPLLDALAARAPGPERDPLRKLLGALLQTQLDSRHVPMLDRLDALFAREPAHPSHRRAAESLLADAPLFIDATALIREIERAERAFTFVYLARRFRCLLSGECDLSPWKCPVKSIGFVAHEQQASSYARARCGLSVMRWQDDAGLHPKVLEIGASGCVPLVAARVGIEDLLRPDHECIVFSSPADAARRLTALLTQPDRLDALAAAALDRIRREHTWKTRTETILESLGKWTGRW